MMGNKYRKRLTLLSFIMLCSCSYLITRAQSKKQKLGFSSESDRGKVELVGFYLDSARYLTSKAPLKAIDKINKAIELSIMQKDIQSESDCYYILGNIQQGVGQHEMAISNYKKSIRTMPDVEQGSFKVKKTGTPGNRSAFYAYRNMTLSLLQLNRTEEALESIQHCTGNGFYFIPAAEKLDAKRIQADVVFKQGRGDESLSILQTVLDQEKSIANLPGIIKTQLALGNLYQQRKSESRAIEYFNQAKNTAEKEKLADMQLLANNSLAQVYRQQKNAEKEALLRNDNIMLSNSTQSNSASIKQQNLEIGNGYLNSNQNQKALPFFEKTLIEEKKSKVPVPEELFGKSNDLEGMANTYKLLAEEYLKMGDNEQALMYLQKFVHLLDSIKTIRKNELDSALKLSNELGKNQQRIDLLEKERNLNEKSIEILKQDRELKESELGNRNMIIGTLCFLLLFMGVGAYYILKSAREKRRAHQLLAIKSLRGQMNPHFIFNALNAVNHYISQNDELSANKYLSEFSRLMRSVMETSKHDLISLSEELEILKLYLQLEHARFKDKFNYTFMVADDIDPSEFEVPPMIIQPFIENAVWHGLRYTEDSGLLCVNFSQNKGNLVVSIIDNGIGRKKSQEIKTKNQRQQHSTGMKNIETRLGIMNELFRTTIRAEVRDAFPDAKNPGTRVELVIPKKIDPHA